jgi:Protein of unknown function (DUF1822)
MIDQPSTLSDLAMPFPITSATRRQARAYAAQYFIPDTRGVYLNTLAVLVADNYLRLLNFQTNLAQPERWNAADRLWGETSELELVGLGKIECRAVLAGQTVVFLPPETWVDRIGYLFIEVAASEKAAKLVGFLPEDSLKISEAEVIIKNLQSIDQMIDYLTDLEESRLSKEFVSYQITYLKNWLNNIYEAGWEPALRDLSVTTGQKKISLSEQVFLLQVAFSQSSDESIGIRINIRAESGFLPKGLQVSVPDENEIYIETVNEPADLIIIPLEFLAGEDFWVNLQMGADSIREYFIV